MPIGSDTVRMVGSERLHLGSQPAVHRAGGPGYLDGGIAGQKQSQSSDFFRRGYSTIGAEFGNSIQELLRFLTGCFCGGCEHGRIDAARTDGR